MLYGSSNGGVGGVGGEGLQQHARRLWRSGQGECRQLSRDLSIGLITGYDGQRALDNGLRRPAEYRGCGRALKGDFFFVHQGRRLASACLERSNNGVDGARQLAGGGGTMGTVSDHEASFGAAEV
ncbi:hypothetical protein ACCO45_001449 [Purpureocillium lilacinum]|uniref:Uncharacterized protein n=1 Tax=Purpureocillium lilacinum TaxID=33203 RepID=A0ACC4E9V0_PURLI